MSLRLGLATVVVALTAALAPSAALAHAGSPALTHTGDRAVAAQGGGQYTVPPTNSGALGISKNSWGKASDVANGVAAVAAGVAAYSAAVAAGLSIPTLGMSVPTAGAVALGAGLVSAGAWTLGSVFSYLSRDPADRHFRTIFKPRFPTLPAIPIAPQYANIGSALHALLHNEVHLVGLSTAFVTSINRITGARRAHATVWVHRQQRAAAKYAREAAKLRFGFERERDAIAAAYATDGINLVVPASAVAQAKSQAASAGLSPSMLAGLKIFASATRAKSLKHRILNTKAILGSVSAAPPSGFAFNAALPSPTLALKEDKVAGALVGYAKSVTGKHRH